MNTLMNSTATMPNLLQTRAMLMTLVLRGWSARKLDKKVTSETNAKYNAKSDAGRYNKQLLAKAALAEIQKIDGEIRNHFYLVTSPWVNREGVRIISNANVAEALAWFRNKGYERTSAVERLRDNYVACVEQAKADLNGMFNSADYPPIDSMVARFQFDVSIDPVPCAGDFRVEIPQEQADDIRREIEARSHAAVATIVNDCYARIGDVVGRMHERLTAYKPATNDTDKAEGIFRNSLVENVRALTALLPGLNVTGDPALAAIAQRMQALCSEDAKDLRVNHEARKSVADDAAAILADISDFLA